MTIRINTIHIGKVIERRLKEQKITQVEFANLLGITQPSVNALLKKPSMDTARLERISSLLNYNFFKEYCDRLKDTKDNTCESVNMDTGTVPVSLYRELRDENKRILQKLFDLEKELISRNNS